MKPSTISLVRHGESEGNVNKTIYRDLSDWKVSLTANGRDQARKAGVLLNTLVSETNPRYELPFPGPLARVYCSPWYRARQTADEIISQLHFDIEYREDPRLREQEWGNFQIEEIAERIKKERYKFGTFFYRMPDGESGADVFDRISGFLDTLYRDFQSNTIQENVIIVTHGLTLRLFLMRWFHWSVEEFESLENPENCQIVNLKYNRDKDKYYLTSDLVTVNGSLFQGHKTNARRIIQKAGASNRRDYCS